MTPGIGSPRLWKKFFLVLFISSLQIVVIKLSYDQQTFQNQFQNELQQQEQEQQQQLQQQRQRQQQLLQSQHKGVDNIADKAVSDVCRASNSGDDNYVDELTFMTDPERKIGYCHVPKVASSSW